MGNGSRRASGRLFVSWNGGSGRLWPCLLVAGAVLLANGCYKPTAQPAPQPAPPPAAPPPAPAPLTMSDLAPVTLQPGQSATVKVAVNRGGQSGPVQVQATAAPQGIAVQPLEIPADKTEGLLQIAAAEALGENEVKATIKVAARAGAGQAEKSFEVTVPKITLPAFQAVKETLLQPGGSQTVDVVVNRNGFAGPLELKVENLPPKVTARAAKLEAGQSTAKLEIAAAPDAPDVKQPFRVASKAYGRAIGVDVPVQIDRTPFRVQSFLAVHIKPGEKKRIEIPVERRSYNGALQLEPKDLPEGVTIKKVEVAPDQKSVALEIVAAENAKRHVRTAKMTAKGGALSATESLVIRVRGDEEGFLPAEVANDPTMVLLRRGSFGGRLTTKSKRALLEAYGGTPESEAAVMRGLAWLAGHQQEDGSWLLAEYGAGVDGCNCRDASAEKEVKEEKVAGTAFGVLPFLGAGVAIDQGPDEPAELVEYQKRVKAAIGFLVRQQTVSRDPLQDGRLSGNLYAHAAATIALCEAYGLSSERWKERMRLPVQKAIKFIANAQHQKGGWRYAPRQEGDMSAVAWQFLAIRSGQLAGIQLGNDPLLKAEHFVDSCAAGPAGAEKAQYSYQPGEGAKGTRPSLTAAGLLTRQYLGKWKKDNPDLAAGCKVIMQNLPPESGTALGPIYYYYYATQVLHHMEGSDFDLWNSRIREHLIRTQEKAGHRAGSWSPAGTDWGSAGGRLYATGMALMTLEVYYRHLPMYRSAAGRKAAASAEE